MYNFSIQYQFPVRLFGDKLPNKTWNGVVQQLNLREIDVMPGIGVSWPRTVVMDYTIPFIIDTIYYVTRAPSTKPKSLAIIYPFTPQVWLTFVVTLATCTVLFYSMFYYAAQITGLDVLKANKLAGVMSISPGEVLWCLVASVLRQDAQLPQPISSRLLAGVWMLLMVVVSGSYCGVLTGFLTFPAMEDPLDSIDQLHGLLEAGTYTAGTLKGTYFADNLKSSRRKKLSNIGYHMDRDPANFSPGFREGLLRTLTEDYAFIVMNFALRITRAMESGLVVKWTDDLHYKQRIQAKRPEGFIPGAPMTLEHLQGGFVVLVLGSVLACVSFIIEVGADPCIAHWRRFKNRVIR